MHTCVTRSLRPGCVHSAVARASPMCMTHTYWLSVLPSAQSRHPAENCWKDASSSTTGSRVAVPSACCVQSMSSQPCSIGRQHKEATVMQSKQKWPGSCQSVGP